jgi:hypothetical protein
LPRSPVSKSGSGFLGSREIEPRGAARCEQSLKVRASVQAGAVADGLAPRDVLHEILHAALKGSLVENPPLASTSLRKRSQRAQAEEIK